MNTKLQSRFVQEKKGEMKFGIQEVFKIFFFCLILSLFLLFFFFISILQFFIPIFFYFTADHFQSKTVKNGIRSIIHE
jgi:hypothetical protein